MSTISIAAGWEMTREPDFRTVWRWHFYTGLFWMPLTIESRIHIRCQVVSPGMQIKILSSTGSSVRG